MSNKKFDHLKAILQMAEEDNKCLLMSATTLGGKTVGPISEVRFRVTDECVDSANAQSVGLPSEYMCVAFFIKRSELSKYLK